MHDVRWTHDSTYLCGFSFLHPRVLSSKLAHARALKDHQTCQAVGNTNWRVGRARFSLGPPRASENDAVNDGEDMNEMFMFKGTVGLRG